MQYLYLSAKLVSSFHQYKIWLLYRSNHLFMCVLYIHCISLSLLISSLAITSRDVLVTSGLSIEQLASVWNLADVDRDSKLSLDEFGIACHMVRFIKKGLFIDMSLNTRVYLYLGNTSYKFGYPNYDY